ncbi:MAG: hypothetical protein KC415_12505, partial [Anaerolineales bacterium]|nr:hypothetical protein [Anaerolineales bacterium]
MASFGRKHLRRIIVLGVLFALIAWWQRPFPTHAQEQSASYWDYPTSGRLQHLVPADVNNDGINELLTATENGRINLIDANGSSRWSYETGEPILSLSAINSRGPQTASEIAVGLAGSLLLLSPQGDLLWQMPLEAAAPPPVLLTGGGTAALADWQA